MTDHQLTRPALFAAALILGSVACSTDPPAAVEPSADTGAEWATAARPHLDALGATFTVIDEAVAVGDLDILARACRSLAAEVDNTRGQVLPSPVAGVNEPLTAALDEFDLAAMFCVDGIERGNAVLIGVAATAIAEGSALIAEATDAVAAATP